MPTIEVWVALNEDDSYEVATDEYTARERLVNESDVDLAGTACRIVRLNITMSVPHSRDNGDKTDKAVDVTIPDDAGHIVKI
jgi:hypothetical protein